MLVLPFGTIDTASVPVAGGKAANLGAMSRAGLPVPPGFCVTTTAYEEAAATLDIESLVTDLAAIGDERSPRAGELSATLRARLLAAPISPALHEAMASAYHSLSDPPAAVAVRSSATAEDLPHASFAGQQDTYLHVVGLERVCDAMRRCWASLWNDRAVTYRTARHVDHRTVRLAVIVQRMVPAEVAGVMFTADPVTGRRHRTVISASYGLGEAVVSGLVNPDHFVVERGVIQSRHIGDKRLAIQPSPEGGTVQVDLPDGRGSACLTDEQVSALGDLGRIVEAHYGSPQDVEFAFDPAGRLWLLQTRPMTALPPEPPDVPAPTPRAYSRRQRLAVSAIRDHMPLAFHPFDYSLFLRPTFTRMLQSLPYLGFAPVDTDEVLHQAADGVYQIVPPSLRPTPRIIALPFKILLAAMRANPDRWLAECEATLVPLAEETERADLATFTDAGLLDRIEAIARCSTTLFPSRFANLPGGIVAALAFPRLLRLAVGARASEFERRLQAAIPCVSFDANQEMARLAQQVRRSGALRSLFRREPAERLPDLLTASAEGRTLLAEVDGYLVRFGLREATSPGTSHPAWRDEPRLVYGLLKGFASGESDGSPAMSGPSDVDVARSELAAVSASRWLGLGRWTLAPLLEWLVGVGRYYVAFRENSHYYLFIQHAVNRRLALELGRRLSRQGALETPDDLFFLRVDEIWNLVSDRSLDARAIVRRRRAARGPGDGRYGSVPTDLLELTMRGDDVRGEGASAGQATGRVRVIRRVEEFGAFQQGEVLVAPFTNPTWTPLFQLASAVVVDAGGLASHAAIVAREHGIPAVMGTGNATTVLLDGDRVLVDGDRGLVTRLGRDAVSSSGP